jgi:hypothetical protein
MAAYSANSGSQLKDRFTLFPCNWNQATMMLATRFESIGLQGTQSVQNYDYKISFPKSKKCS